ncbi:MAG: GNAT family N-acetyltransferase [Acidobacteriota bacterium]|nr:MAG: GNAT family N-acetyltransferase [Acidobacteriota bacterium]
MKYLNQYAFLDHVEPEQMDRLWARGWRHFGTYFFRYSVTIHDERLYTVIPLRIRLADFRPSRSQKRTISKNRDARVEIRESCIDRTRMDLFSRHRSRFRDNVPDTIFGFLSEEPAKVPCRNLEIAVYLDDRLIAANYLDLGLTASSAVYSIFDPDESSRSPGIFLILEGIRHSIDLGLRYYYLGYAYREPYLYDYKKKFSALEAYDWSSGWGEVGSRK